MDPTLFDDSYPHIPLGVYRFKKSSLFAEMILSAGVAVWAVQKVIDIFKQIKKDRYISMFKRNSKSKYRVRKRIVPYKRQLRNHITMH